MSHQTPDSTGGADASGAERPSDASRVATWAGLLARWMEFAKAAVALPVDGDGGRWRASVAPLISLHAITLALAEIEFLPEADRSLARDRAAVGVREACGALGEIWRGESLPTALGSLRDDALLALERAAFAGAVELRWHGVGVGEVPDLGPHGPGGTLCVMPPGTPVMPGEPIAWWIGRPGLCAEGCTSVAVQIPHQVYRQLDLHGRAVRDIVLPVLDEPPPGMPLLVPLLEEGRAVGHFPADAQQWSLLQRGAMPTGGVPVQFPATTPAP